MPSDTEWYLYGVMAVDKAIGPENVETGLCFFADQQIDRSPTGGCVAARMALAHARGVPLNQSIRFDSFVSNAFGRGGFIGSNGEQVDIPTGHGLSRKGVTVRIEGEAFDTGAAIFVVEPEDPIKDGFSVAELEKASSSV